MKLFNDFGVRALMGTITVTGAVVTLSWLAIVFQDTSARQILGDALIAIIGFYFGMKAGQNSSVS